MKLRSKWRDFDCDESISSETLKHETERSTPMTLASIGDVSDTSQTAPNVTNVANVIGVESGEFAERAAIIATETGAPDEWCEGLARLSAMQRPGVFSQSDWMLVIDAVARFLDGWGAEAHRLGWSTEHALGLHRRAPLADFSKRGVAYFSEKGGPIESLTATTAIFRSAGGNRLTRHRKFIAPGGVPPWRFGGE